MSKDSIDELLSAWEVSPRRREAFSSQVIAGRPRGPLVRVSAAVLAVFLGPFGAHRLHLGTSPKVVVLYGATFGGFGILPLIDLGHLLFARDRERFRNNDKLLMWR